jgi:hypothetical protein
MRDEQEAGGFSFVRPADEADDEREPVLDIPAIDMTQTAALAERAARTEAERASAGGGGAAEGRVRGRRRGTRAPAGGPLEAALVDLAATLGALAREVKQQGRDVREMRRGLEGVSRRLG